MARIHKFPDANISLCQTMVKAGFNRERFRDYANYMERSIFDITSVVTIA
jgi:hypothetical protein